MQLNFLGIIRIVLAEISLVKIGKVHQVGAWSVSKQGLSTILVIQLHVYVHVCYAIVVDCYWMLSAILEYTAYNNLVQLFSNQDKVVISPMELPNRMEGSYVGAQALLHVPVALFCQEA